MPRHQVVISIVGLLTILILYQLPRVVVENESQVDLSENNNRQDRITHDIELPADVAERINNLRQTIGSNTTNPGKIAIFADSLARSFIVYNMPDSAAKYAELITRDSSSVNLEKAGNIYYQLFGLVSDAGKIELYGERVRDLYQEVSQGGLRPDLEARVAMTYVTGSNPMQAIEKLRQIAEDHPDNTEAHYNLGLLSIRSGQYDKAIERFRKVIELEPGNLEGYFYLGVSFFEAGNTEKARENFDHVINNGNDPALIELVANYLSRIN